MKAGGKDGRTVIKLLRVAKVMTPSRPVRFSSVQIPSLRLLSADADLNTAAITEGLLVDDPNTQPALALAR